MPNSRRCTGKDALVTNIPGICIAVSTADCVPVLVYAPDKKVVAAIHAGWRGTVKQIVAKTIRCMADRYSCDPALMMAGIAPSISKEAFEVGEEVVDAFRETRVDMNRIMERNAQTGKAHIDLWRQTVSSCCNPDYCRSVLKFPESAPITIMKIFSPPAGWE